MYWILTVDYTAKLFLLINRNYLAILSIDQATVLGNALLNCSNMIDCFSCPKNIRDFAHSCVRFMVHEHYS